MLSEQEKRTLIKSIRTDITLSDNEKNKKIQQIMMGKYTPDNIYCIKSNYSKTCNHHNKKCYKFHFKCCNIYDPCTRCHRERENPCEDELIKVDKITCVECEFEQDPNESCSKCFIKFSDNYCSICNIFTHKDIVHCEYCKICRIGKKDELFHCFNCNGCFFVKDKINHKCNINLKEHNCSVCGESIFNSASNINIPDCNHPIHINCLQKSIEHNQYKCSICKKSIIDMNSHWNMIRINIANTPLPRNIFPIIPNDIVDSPYGKFKVLEKNIVNKITLCNGILINWKLKNNNLATATFDESILNKKIIKDIYCNDCQLKSLSEFHFYGIECKHCGSFNTQE